MPELLAEVTRSGFVESKHYGSVAAVAPGGAISRGEVDDLVLPRSTAKPFQALACLNAGAPLEGRGLAIAAGSHTGEQRHVEVVRAILGDLKTTALKCPESWPEDEQTRARLSAPSKIRMNCSGKHAAMLAACRVKDWPIDSYLDADHPLQRQVRDHMEAMAGEKSGHIAVDGCGAPLFAVSLKGLALATQQLMDTPVAQAMRAHPEFVGGTGHVNTAVMRLLPGVVAKGGAEGVLVLGTTQGHAVAVKVIDGSPRATTAIGLTALSAMGFDVSGAEALLRVPVLGGGQVVGEVRVTW